MPSEEKAIKAKATIEGHPWDLWGLAKLFDGTNEHGLLVEAAEPAGLPIVDYRDPVAVARYRRSGHAQQAKLTADALTWASMGELDIKDAARLAQALVTRINGIAKLLDPGYLGVNLVAVEYKGRGGSGGSVLGEVPPNKGPTSLGRHPAQAPFALAAIDLAKEDAALEFALEAFSLPISWASLYLVYDCIAGTVGGTKALKNKNWVPPKSLEAFSTSANAARQIRTGKGLGIRHGKNPESPPQKQMIPLHAGHDIIMQLTMTWIDARLDEADQRRTP